MNARSLLGTVVVLFASGAAADNSKQWDCPGAVGADKYALVSTDDLVKATDKDQCLHVRYDGGAPDGAKAVLVKDPRSFATVCPVILTGEPVHNDDCTVDGERVLHKYDRIQINYVPSLTGEQLFSMSLWDIMGDAVVSAVTMRPGGPGEKKYGWLSGQDMRHRYFVYLDYSVDPDTKHLRKTYRIEVFDKDGSHVVCQDHQPSKASMQKDCTAFTITYKKNVATLKPRQGSTGSGGEPPPNGK